MAGQVRVWARIVCGAADAGREDGGGRLCWDERGVLVLVHDDPLEQGTVQDAAFRRVALAVEVAQIGEDVGDLVEAGADAVLFALEQVEWDRVGVVGLGELESFGFELVALVGQQDAFVIAGGFELVQHRADVLYLILGESVAAVCVFDTFFEAAGDDRGAGAAGLFPTPAGAGEVFVAVTLLVAGPLDHELGAA